LKLDEKKRIVEELSDKFAKSRVAIVTDYKGLNVAAMNSLRKKLREVDVEYRVVKNSLLTRASEGNDVSLIKENFVGPSAVALSYEDAVAPAKVLVQFAKENGKLEIKAGVMGGKLLDAAAIKALSALPSREALLGQLLSVMNGVPTNFVRVLNAIPQQMVNVLVAVKDQKEQSAQ
jgi:large subunit ribosomal protein L10